MATILKGFVEGPTRTRIIRDADSKLDYIIDLTDWLAGHMISSVTTVSSGVTVVSCHFNEAPLTVPGYGEIGVGRAVIIWLSGGATGVGGDITLRVTTTGGQEEDFTYPIVTRQG